MVDYSNKTWDEMSEIKKEFRSKKMEEYCIVIGTMSEEFAKDFVKFANTPLGKSRVWFANFNGKFIFSNDKDLTEDNIVKLITGKTIAEKHKQEQEYREKLLREQKEWEDALPAKIEEYIKMGHEVLDKKYWDTWDKCVPIRLGDLYRGAELDKMIELMKMIHNKDEYENIYDTFEKQGHSGMSFGLVKSLLKAFGGEDFVNWINENKK